MIERLRQDGHMAIAWQHVGAAAAARGEVVMMVVMLCRRLECWVLGSGRGADGVVGGGGRRSEECLEGG